MRFFSLHVLHNRRVCVCVCVMFFHLFPVLLFFSPLPTKSSSLSRSVHPTIRVFVFRRLIAEVMTTFIILSFSVLVFLL